MNFWIHFDVENFSIAKDRCQKANLNFEFWIFPPLDEPFKKLIDSGIHFEMQKENWSVPELNGNLLWPYFF